MPSIARRRLLLLVALVSLTAPVLLHGAQSVARAPIRVRVLVEGQAPRTVVAPLDTVGDALEAAGVRAASTAVVRPARAAPVDDGDRIRVEIPTRIEVLADGRQRVLLTTGQTVGEALRTAGVSVGPYDEVVPPPTTPVDELAPVQGRIRVRRVTFGVEDREITIPRGVEERETDDLLEGERRVADEGADGRAVERFRVRRADGRVIARTVVGRSVLEPPRPRVVHVGTRPPPPPEPPAPPEPDPEPANVQSGTASWYHAPGGGMTAAHRTLPFGTVVTVTNSRTGKSVQVTIADRGPFIDGRVVDLSRDAFAAIAPLSTGVIPVRVTW